MRHHWLVCGLISLAIVTGSCQQGGSTETAQKKQEKAASQRTESAEEKAIQVEEKATLRQTKVSEATVPSLQARIQQLYDAKKASVVNVTTQKVATNIFSLPIPQKGTASGFVYDDKGHIVTSSHNVKNAEHIAVSFGESEMMEAELVGKDSATDLAVLKVDKEDLPEPLDVGNSEDLHPGEFVAALGNPFGLERTLTFGVVSAVGRVIRSPNGHFISEAIQTDAPINPGNSGGPLLDLDGRVLGVNAMIVSPSGGSSGVGFAIPAHTVKTVCPVLIEKGAYPHPWLGLQGVNLNKTWVNILKGGGMEVPVESGFLVVKTPEGSPADEAGIQGGDEKIRVGLIQLPVGGDILVKIEDTPVDTYKDLMLYLESHTEIGQEVEVTLYRDGDAMVKTVTVGERPVKGKETTIKGKGRTDL